jgi:hypothetical protein
MTPLAIGLAMGSWFAIASTPATATPVDFAQALQAAGQTDVGLRMDGDTAIATFTNRTWWRPGRAIGEALLLLSTAHPEANRYRLVLQRDRLPIATVEVAGGVYRAWLAGTGTDDDLVSHLTCTRGPGLMPERSRSSAGWLDLGLAPTYSLARELSLGLAETWHATLADGLGAVAETQQAWSGPAMRPVETAQVYTLGWLDESWFYRASLGFFGRPGWAIQLDLSRRTGEVEWRLDAGVTTTGAGTLSGVAVWPSPWLGMIWKVEAGRYLDGDVGGRASALWNFERSQLETSLISTSSGVDLRTVLTLDLAGPRRAGSGPLRVTAGEAFVPYQAERATRARRLTYVDPFDRLFLDLSVTELGRCVKQWPRTQKCPPP